MSTNYDYDFGSLAHDETIVDVATSSVKDTYDLQKLVKVKTTTGSIKSRINVAEHSSPHRTVDIHSNTGSIDVDFLTALGPISHSLKTTISSKTGSIKLTVPEEWCGTVYVTVNTGSVKIKDDYKRVKTLRDEVRRVHDEDNSHKERERRQILAIRGVERAGQGSEIRIDSGTGSIRLTWEKRSKADWMKNLPEGSLDGAMAGMHVSPPAPPTFPTAPVPSGLPIPPMPPVPPFHAGILSPPMPPMPPFPAGAGFPSPPVPPTPHAPPMPPAPPASNRSAPEPERYESASAEKRRLAKADEARAEAESSASAADAPPSYEESESGPAPESYHPNTGLDEQ